MLKRINIALLSAALLGATAAHAEMPGFEFQNPTVSSRWNVDLGGYLIDLDTTVSVGVGSAVGTTINLENVLGLETDQKILRLGGFYRFKPKHALAVEFLQINRDSTLVIDEAFEHDGVLYDVNAFLASTFDMTLFKLTYRYSFVNNGRVNAGFSAGLDIFDFDTSIAGVGSAIDDQGNVGTATLEETSEGIIAPVPALGMFIDYAIRRWLILHMSAEFLDLDTGDFEMTLQDTKVTLDFYVTKHFGLGLGITGTDLRVANKGNDPWKIDYRFDGVIFYAGVAF